MDCASLHLDYVSSDELAAQPTSWWTTVLGVVGFDEAPQLPGPRVPVTASMTPSLDGAESFCEIWRVAGSRNVELSTGLGEGGRVQYRHCNKLLFGSISLCEERFEGSRSEALLCATQTAYQEIFAVLAHTGHRHLIRVWNYLPEINVEADGDERYRHFNSARQSAFRNSGRSTVGTVPAASALGSPAGRPISIYFLASSESPQMIENPRQTSAYLYPPEFGVHSPTFSRACMLRDYGGTNLFVSGTASIVGHETLHRGDVAAQTREALTNIDALLNEANRMLGSKRYLLDSLKFKVYVRQPADFARIKAVLATALGPSPSIVYLKADVCRADLLVEIEAVGASARRCSEDHAGAATDG